ncbi:hypothetical protein BRAS3843_230058 [Bradyrhizobium sp. STM 3843]|nr:hypothetical protein BRAS3843_230058 [Bradyrhizobium sp. STM 3843]
MSNRTVQFDSNSANVYAVRFK